MNTGGVRIAFNESDLNTFVRESLGNPLIGSNGRKCIVNRFVAPLDGHSGERLAKLTIKEL